MNENLSKKAVSGVFWNNLSSYFQSAARFAAIIYLSRRIDPVFFGKQGMAAAIAMIVYSLVMFGQEYAIPRQKNDIDAYVSMHVFLRIVTTTLIGAVLTALYFLTGGLGSKEIFLYVLMLFLSQLPSQITSIYDIYMLRELLFGRIAFINMCSVSFGVILGCGLAFFGYTIEALLWLLMGEYLMKAALTAILSPKRFLPIPNKEKMWEFLKYGKHVFLSNLFLRVHDKIDDVAVGSLVGSVSLGFYQRAYALGNLLHSVVTGGVAAVITPVFAKIREEKDRLGRYFELAGGLILRASVGGYFWMAIVLPQLIVLLYGEKWLGTVPLFRLMLPYALVQSFNVALRNTHLVAGESSLVAKIKFIELAILMVLLFPLIYMYKTAGAAIAVDLSAIGGTVLFIYFLRPLAKFSLKRLFVPPAVAVTIALIGWGLLSPMVSASGSLITQIIFNSMVFVTIYIGILAAMEFFYWKNIFLLLKNIRQPVIDAEKIAVGVQV